MDTINKTLARSNNNVIVKSNHLVNARYNLNLIEMKIIYKVITMIHKDDKDFYDYTMKISDLIDFVGTNSNKLYSELKLESRELLKKVFSIKQDKKLIQLHWFSSIVYEDGFITFRIDPHLKPYLIQLSEYFTKIDYSNIRKFKCKYSFRVYEFLKQYVNLAKKTASDKVVRRMTIDEIKYLLCIEGEYPLYSDFKKRVILSSQKEINNYSDLFFEFEEIKLGRKIHEIDFIVSFNDKTTKDTTDELESGDEEGEDEGVQKVVQDFNLKYNANLDPILTKNLIKLKGLDCVMECIKEFSNFVSNANEIEKVFYDFTRKYGTGKAYTKATAYHNAKPIQATNYEQRTYTDEEINALYDNVTFVK